MTKRLRDVEMDTEEMQMKVKYGEIQEIEFTGYGLYRFRFDVTTDLHDLLYLTTGGDADRIYDYDPTSTSWREHIAAGIVNIDVDQSEE